MTIPSEADIKLIEDLAEHVEKFKKTIEKAGDKIYEDNKKLLRESKNFFASALFKLKHNIKKNADVANYIHGSLLKYEKTLKAIKETNENVDETLCNVLLAIRQNEYLQSWHPAQHGYPEIKVTGKHPAKVKAAS